MNKTKFVEEHIVVLQFIGDTMFRLILLILVLSPSFEVEASDEKQEEILTQRCLGTFEIIKNKDLKLFVSQMPVTPTEHEVKRSGQVLARAYERWFVKEKVVSIEAKGVSYKQPSKTKVDKFDAINQAKVKLFVVGEKYRSTVSCKFIETPKGWFLSSLP
ncbi:hypothetical protein EXU30_07260 [Shewanella maritima]|uniref:DUF4019 domain-containing protein n=1 Tax=Shewanella maritima TaxID=2520507 RepID=A0A411PFZ9_9GAMM|nr:hypothetical protein [Shewanella maritima]QBF82517.1 hypothetical protein EXU30_07260 [Shewanella maritima]